MVNEGVMSRMGSGDDEAPARTTRATYDRIAARFLERTRDRTAMVRWLDQFAEQLPTGALVLDVGCGPGVDGALLRRRGLRVVGFDASLGMIRSGCDEFPGAFVQADLGALPVEAGVADGVWANASLLHVEREKMGETLGELARVLRPGGVLFASVKAGLGEAWDRSRHGADAPRWFVYWRASDFDARLAAAGFRVFAGGTMVSHDQWIIRLARSAR